MMHIQSPSREKKEHPSPGELMEKKGGSIN